MQNHEQARQRMVERQIEGRGIRNRHVLEAMREVPREEFVSGGMEGFAYEDSALPIEEGQTISQPYIVALMLDAVELVPGDRVLEVGAGSGYAAAVMSRIAGQVHAVERHGSLARAAQSRFDRLGYSNIELHVGDGSQGLPDAAPFDAILVAAGAPEPPQALREQLSVGGCLVIPVGTSDRLQRLSKIRRVAEDRFEEEDLGAVSFVPLVGKQGWPEKGSPVAAGAAVAASPRQRESRERQSMDTVELLEQAAEQLPSIDDQDFAKAFDRYADSRVVLLGEASHGTSEFYRARAAITRRLVEKHGFDIVAVEADWPDAMAINRHVRGMERRAEGPIFQRFPQWMWRNAEVAELVDWMQAYNSGREHAEQVGFYGLDMYSMAASIEAVLDYLDREDPEAAAVARERYGCLTPWQNSPATYGRAAITAGYSLCKAPVVAQCREMLEKRLGEPGNVDEELLDATQNARLVASAESYYRVMYEGGEEAWNLRDTHMFETLEHLLKAHGPKSRAVVWAHNSHIGDARHTEMGKVRDELNIGQLCRQRFGDQAALVGFGTHAGTVAAANDWDGPMELLRVRPSLEGSIEALCHATGIPRFLLDLRKVPEPLRTRLDDPLLQRFIGVVYRPRTERYSHYAAASLASQYDGYVWFDHTGPVQALAAGKPPKDPRNADTWPFGL